MLHRPSRLLDVQIPQPPDRSNLFYVFCQPEGVAQQPIGMQLHQPLALLHVRFPSRHIFGVLGIHQRDLNVVLPQDIAQRNPVHPGGLYRDPVNLARFQPLSHAV